MIKSLRALCFLVYDQVQGIKQWKATLIFIKGLLEDEQGLSMGELFWWISVDIEYFLYIGFDYDLQLTRHWAY
jgi:hypothetical protein